MALKAPTTLSEPKLIVLRWLGEDPTRKVYGPMSGTSGNRSRYGFAGGNGDAAIRKATGDALVAEGLIMHVSDRYPLGYYALGPRALEALLTGSIRT